MMNQWFETRIRYEKTGEDGLTKKVTEPYLVDALSFTEAEKRIIEEMVPFMTGEFQVTAIKRATYAEVVESAEELADRWFACRIQLVTLDEKTARERRTNHDLLFQAATLDDARRKTIDHLSTSLIDYTIIKIAETPIVDVYPYQAKSENKPEFKE